MANAAEPEAENVVTVLKALADPVRLDLFRRIASVDEMACAQLVAEAEVTAATVSYHIKTLKIAGLVDVRKEGRNFHYTAVTQPIDAIDRYLRSTRP